MKPGSWGLVLLEGLSAIMNIHANAQPPVSKSNLLTLIILGGTYATGQFFKESWVQGTWSSFIPKGVYSKHMTTAAQNFSYRAVFLRERLIQQNLNVPSKYIDFV